MELILASASPRRQQMLRDLGVAFKIVTPDIDERRLRGEPALNYVQRAVQLRPSDVETLEQLFHLQNQAKRQGDARRTLEQMRRIKPGEPQYELYELDFVEVKSLTQEKLRTAEDLYRFLIDEFHQSRTFWLETLVVLILLVELVYVFHGKM